jgi:hypothetical protein
VIFFFVFLFWAMLFFLLFFFIFNLLSIGDYTLVGKAINFASVKFKGLYYLMVLWCFGYDF